jgi:2-amino-4-hydroxy-6-hydroxymethyldihydropteridine diphosphokinase
MPETAFSLGSNLGDRLAHLQAARDALCGLPGARLVAQSPVYETDPVGVRSEHLHLKYLNAVVVFEAGADAEAWHDFSHETETRLGRVRTEDRYAPRAIDIDLLYCGGQTISTEPLSVPHPSWSRRLFVVRPLADIRPDARIPGTPGCVRALLPGLSKGPERVAVFARIW